MSLQKTVFGRQKIKPNTFIGGVSATINTPASVASKLGISVSRIKAFSIIGANIQFAVVGGSYTLPGYTFLNNTSITYFDDKDGLCTSLLNQSLRNCSNIILLNFPNVTSIQDYAAEALTSLQTANFPSCTSFGLGGNFVSVPSTCVITAPLIALTNGTNGAPNIGLKNANCLVDYVGYVDDGSWNTEIKGVSATDDTRLKIGRRLGCSPAALLNFQIVGSDIRFKVYGNYTLKASAYVSRTDITAYNDNDNLVNAFAPSSNIIAYCPNITSLKFNGVLSIGSANSSMFRDNTSLNSLTMDNMTTCSSSWLCRGTGQNFTFHFASLVTYNAQLSYGMSNIVAFYAPKLKYLGASASAVEVFTTDLKLNACTVTVDRFMQTSNSGAEEADVAYARNTRGATIVYVDN